MHLCDISYNTLCTEEILIWLFSWVYFFMGVEDTARIGQKNVKCTYVAQGTNNSNLIRQKLIKMHLCDISYCSLCTDERLIWLLSLVKLFVGAKSHLKTKKFYNNLTFIRQKN